MDDEFNEGDEFNGEDGDNVNDYMQHLRNMEKEMMKIDLSRGTAMPLDLSEYIDMFGNPTEEDLYDITQAYIKLYMKQGDDNAIAYVVDAYGEGWVDYLLKYNESIEEYELCSLFKEHLDIYKNQLIQETLK